MAHELIRLSDENLPIATTKTKTNKKTTQQTYG